MVELESIVKSYVGQDAFFGNPYVDLDEWRVGDFPRRYLHGGFEGTVTRFALSFPLPEVYEKRFIQFLSIGPEDQIDKEPYNIDVGGFGVAVRLGAYLVESNEGHFGAELEPGWSPAVSDPTIAAYRASAEVARFAAHAAAGIYGRPPQYGYVFGGGGAGQSVPICLENSSIWDGAVAFGAGGAPVKVSGMPTRHRSMLVDFAPGLNVQRLLGPELARVIDATDPGGTGDPFAGLDSHQREELATLYRLGFPFGAECMLDSPPQIKAWAGRADSMAVQDAEYFDSFWSKAGYLGHDRPELFEADLIDTKATVTRVLTASDLVVEPRTSLLVWFSTLAGATPDLPVAIAVEGIDGYRLGAGVSILTGKAAGRQLYCTGFVGDILSCDGAGAAGKLRVAGVAAGDEILIDNHHFLAYCYYHRHHAMREDPAYESLFVDGVPIYPQLRLPDDTASLGAVAQTGDFHGKLIWLDWNKSCLWPTSGRQYAAAVHRAQGPLVRDRFRMRWMDNAELKSASSIPALSVPVPTTRFVDWQVYEESLHDLIAWVERGIDPPGATPDYRGGIYGLAGNPTERVGVQPVVIARANGAARADVKTGEAVTLEVVAQVPAGAGYIVAADWDFDGAGTWPYRHQVIDGSSTHIHFTTTHAFEEPGTYFPAVRVTSHRHGEVGAAYRRISNLGRVRVVVNGSAGERV
jgi:hypothetical protein